jgi:hypothetical protein
MTVAPAECGDGVWTYFLADGHGEGDVMALEAPSSVVRFHVGAALQPQMLRNLTYRSYDPRLRVHCVTATVRSEVVGKMPEALLERVVSQREQVLLLDDSLKLAVSGGALGALPRTPRAELESLLPIELQDRPEEVQVTATLQPVLEVLRTPFGVSCVAAACTATPSALSCACGGLALPPGPARVLLSLDSGLESRYCCCGLSCLNRVLNDDSVPNQRLLRWLHVLLRSGVCEGAVLHAEAARARHVALCNVKPADLATPAAIVVLLLNSAVVVTEDGVPPCEHARSLLAAGQSLTFRPDEWACFMGLLRDALSNKQWEFTLMQRASVAPKNGWTAPLYDVTGVHPVSPLYARAMFGACAVLDALDARRKVK